MKGIPLFASVTKPKKGDMVFWTKDDNIIRRPWTVDIVLEDRDEVLLEWVHDQAVKFSELQRVVIERVEYKNGVPKMICIPLYSEDYRSIIRFIGRNVDFGIMSTGMEYGFPGKPGFVPTEDTAKLYETMNIDSGSWVDVIEEFKVKTGSSAFATNTFSQWLDKNFHPPKKK